MAHAPKLSALAMAALGLLAERDMHPYEMYQVLVHRHEDRLLKVRPGTLYHAVGRLADSGLVEATGTVKDGNRPERTNYAILPAGRERLNAALRQLLAEPVEEYPRFPQALSEAHNLPPGEVVELLNRRLAALAEELADLDSHGRTAQSRNVPEFLWIDVGYKQHLLRAEMAWLQDLNARIADGSLPWVFAAAEKQKLIESFQP